MTWLRRSATVVAVIGVVGHALLTINPILSGVLSAAVIWLFGWYDKHPLSVLFGDRTTTGQWIVVAVVVTFAVIGVFASL